MPPPDYWPDARRIPKGKLKSFVETVRASRAALGISNAELCREVRALILAHNKVPGRDPVHLKAISGKWEYSEQGKYELGAIIKGTRKYLVGYLAWLCLRDEEAAKDFYKKVDLPFRPYLENEAAAVEGDEFASWASLINTYARFDRVEVLSLDEAGLSLIDLADREPVARALRLDERFCFRLNSPAAGDVLAFQRHRGNWYPLPLAETALHLHIEAGKQILPRQADSGHALPLSETDDAGRYGFAFLIAADESVAALSSQLKAGEPLPVHLIQLGAQIMADLPPNRRAIYRINVLITD